MAIKGVFEPFNKYVTDQLKLRKQMVSNPSSQFGKTIYDVNDEMVGFEQLYTGTTDKRDKDFYTWTTQRQCVIKMISGVDIIPSNPNKGEINILEASQFEQGLGGFLTDEDGNIYSTKKLENEGMAKAYILGSNLGGDNYFYGNPAWRSNPSDGFGIVPPPGITDATIDTKSSDGSLREASVNFVCHNRRQLEVLEALYMRPGYPIMLEWGWDPFVKGSFTEGVNNAHGQVYNNYNGEKIINEFLNPESSINMVNSLISYNKEASGGNYDGFVGYCKNFLFKVREDGGYDCTTEIIAHGEILESLRQKIIMVPTKISPEDIIKTSGISVKSKRLRKVLKAEREPIDEFLLYLRSIKYSLDKAGDKKYIKLVGSENEIETSSTDYLALGLMAPALLLGNSNLAWLMFQQMWNGKSSKYYSYEDDEGNKIDIKELNELPGGNKGIYSFAFQDLFTLTEDITKIPINNLYSSSADWKHVPQNLSNPSSSFGSQTDFTRGTLAWDLAMMDRQHNLGLDSMLEGTILKEQILTDPELVDDEKQTSGASKNIYVRWDLICNIINKRITPEYKKDHALVELTYLHNNEKIYHNGAVEDGKQVNKEAASYIRYNPQIKESFIPSDKSENNSESPRLTTEIWNPAEERSMLVYLDKLEEGVIEEVPFAITPPLAGEEELELNIVNSPTIKVNDLLGRSFDNNICLMPHQVVEMNAENVQDRYELENTFNLKTNLTSWKNTIPSNTSIGLVYLNLKFLIDTYEDLVLEEYKTDLNGEVKYKTRMKKKFNFHDWITTIWNGVNDACGGYYDFGLHVENERPNTARIIDFTFSGDLKNTEKEIFTFEPQGLNSIARESHFQSKIDNDFASAISIAAQAPNDIDSLEASSFKAFHKGIRNRFTSKSENKDRRDDLIEEAEDKYREDLQEYEDMVSSLKFYILRMNQSNYETELIEGTTDDFRKPMGPDTAKMFANQLEEKRISLNSRHPMYGNDGTRNDGKEGRPYTGQYNNNTTHYRNAIIPLTTSMTLDGIAGINPLNVFKISPDKLPYGYQNRNIAFVVKKETHKITAGQDWTTDITGYLTLLHGSPMEGYNELDEEYEENINAELEEIENEESAWINPFEHSVFKTSSWPERASKDWVLYGRYHAGLDLSCATGQLLLAPRDGVVEAHPLGNGTGYGKFLVMNFTEPDTSITHPISGKPAKKAAFAHMDSIYLSPGENFNQGMIVGTCGNTGTNDAHLHYELGTEDFNTGAYWDVKGEDDASGDRKMARVNYALLDPELVLNT